MPSVSDVRPTSHDRHDSLLVAALAAGDLAATDRDHAIDLIETCAECAILHADLIAIARATATVPPPIATRPRDFRLSREQASRLRPSGWRRVVGAFGGPQLAFAKPLGITLTTIGLAGLLLGNVSLGSLGGSAASAPNASAPAAAAYGPGSEAEPTADRALGEGSGSGAAVRPGSSAALVAVPAASAAPRFESAASAPAASVPPTANDQVTGSGSTVTIAGGPKTSASGPTEPSREGYGTSEPLTALSSGPDARTLIFVAAVIVGLGLLVLRRIGRRATAV
jgi:hypothetical protein